MVLVKEEEARKKWCPFSKDRNYPNPELGPFRKGIYNCLGSDCMSFLPVEDGHPEFSGYGHCQLLGKGNK